MGRRSARPGEKNKLSSPSTVAMIQQLERHDLSIVPSRDATPARLCIIDDDLDSVDLLITFLREYGFALNTASDGEDGIRAVQKHRPDLVLLDVQMPPPNGLEVLEALQTAHATRGIPVLMLTGLRDLDSKVAAFRRGAADYVTKPVEAQELHARVLAHLRRARREAAVQQRLNAYRARFGVLEQPWDADTGRDAPQQEVAVLERARLVLRERMADPPSLADLAAEVGMSQSRLSRLFRVLYGTSVFGYLREARLQRARELLITTALSVKAVATMVGYRQTSDLTRGVKARFGMTPTELRRPGH